MFFLLAGGKFFKAIFLVLFIYFASLLAAVSAHTGPSSTNAGNVTLILIGAILFLSGANDIYDLYQAKDFDDFGEQTIKILLTGSYEEILKLLSVINAFFISRE